MSDFSLTLVLQFKTSKIINDTAKVKQKSEKITAFGGILFVLDKFDSILSSMIDSHLGLRSTLIGYQYCEIIRAIFSVFCCGGDCMEDDLPDGTGQIFSFDICHNNRFFGQSSKKLPSYMFLLG